MQTRLLPSLLALLTVAMVMGFSSQALAQNAPPIRIYKVTYSAKANFFSARIPRGNSIRHSGYVVYNVLNPGESVTIEVLPQRRFQINGPMAGNVVPGSIALSAFDRSGNGRLDTEFSFIALTGAGASRTGLIRGSVPSRGFRVGVVPFNSVSRSLNYRGARFTAGIDYFNLSGRWTIDTRLNRTTPNSVAAGVILVETYLLGRNFIAAP
jgi:hypothetical protein